MFDADFFTNNRKRLYKKLGQNGFLMLTANGQMQHCDDQSYKFKQEANFWYLTGLNKSDWFLLVDLHSQKEYLVATKLAWYQEVFDGIIDGGSAAKISGISEVLNDKQGRQLLNDMLKKYKTAYTILPRPRKYYGFYTNRAQYDLVKKLKSVEVKDIRLKLQQLRAIKQPVEIEAIQKAIDITSVGITEVVRQLPNIKYEYEAEAILSYEFRRRGASGHFFDPIVASGANSQTLHYVENNSPIKKPTWLLMDVGAEYCNYGGDISRTLPVGSPTKRQQDIFNSVKNVHDLVIRNCQPGMSVKDYIDGFERAMGEELISLGLIKNLSDKEQIYKWMPHAVSHGLGIDPHDSLGGAKTLEEGMVLTVEPGIYVKADNVGMRIEDDVLITKDGPVVLSGKLPVVLAR
ncbi:MAG: Xaa-Pro aminopeptidase [Candidatus Woesebacteria bacterium]|jgi:Xaa-Pro aminopeptidase